MSINVPEWIDETFLEKILRASKGDKNLKISDFDVASLDNNREHYASTIFKATVKYANKFKCEETMKLLIKLVVPKPNAFSDGNSFSTELNMYISTLPDMQLLWTQNGDSVEFAPKLLFSSKDPVPVLVFEDVSADGYCGSAGPLSLEDTKIVIRKLAKFHAASIQIEQDGNRSSIYKHGLFNLNSRDGLNFMRNNMYLFADELKTWTGFEVYAEKLHNVAKRFDELGRKVYEPNSSGNGFNVLNHGDFHFNNMLFKRNDAGEICDVLFVDYQMTKWGSPSIDLLSLLYLVASREVLASNRDELIVFYYQELVKCLQVIGFISKLPNVLDLYVELQKNGFLEVAIAVCFIPFMFMDQIKADVSVAFENGIEGIELRKKLYGHPEFKAFISNLLPKYLHKGLLL